MTRRAARQRREVELYADRTRGLPVVDPGDRELVISCGAAVCPRLRHAIGRRGFPQLLLRMGYGTEVRPTPRRSVAEVLE
jgi:hypothetical protein